MRIVGSLFVSLLVLSTVSFAAPDRITVNGSVKIPRIEKAPPLEAFLEMKPSPEWAGKLAKVDAFLQREPKDGAPAMNRTEVYLGYDDKNFYAIFICFDDKPGSVRSRLARRDNIGPEDDEVQVYLDTFNDQRRSYGFMTNPKGVQFDYLWTEENGYDPSFDTVWYSDGRRTPQGWVASFTIPFKSMRFPATRTQRWGLLLQRVNPRTNENLFWPQSTKNVSGRLTQEGQAEGMEKISPGRNMQFIPYVAGRSFRAPDLRDPANPQFGGAHFRPDYGLDAKIVLKDSFVLDATLNPDFGQVESDEPQVTVNQRFEVFFPEKRPFFLENSDFFNTPITLLFTRRIADPQYGIRLTGKQGPYKLGILFADDQSPGRVVPDADPLRDKRAKYGVFRGARDLWKGSSIGVLYTHRQFLDDFNRVSSVDGRLKFGSKYTMEFQGVLSDDKDGPGPDKTGTSFHLWFERSGKHFYGNTQYTDTSEHFLTRTGFFRRPDIRRWSNYAEYFWWPEKPKFVNHGFSAFNEIVFDHSGKKLSHYLNANYRVRLARQTSFGAFGNFGFDRLRPKDFSTLVIDQEYNTARRGIFFGTAWFKQLSMNGEFGWGTDINYVPADPNPPVKGKYNYINLYTTVKPFSALTIGNTYFLNRYRDRATDSSSFTLHILRSRWNYQFTKAISARFIMQYTSLLANPNFTSLSKAKRFNTDVLLTWLPHPGTALYLGYNTNLSNPDPTFNGPGTPPNRFINDSRGLFFKASYLFRF
ncbi:MAG: carbohydrate binding family 9 domain-containing protein [Acidobacteriales bacterium]|nr:carbohydrate binding family 9 domain-containing protein [Terriglobales bacterium]